MDIPAEDDAKPGRDGASPGRKLYLASTWNALEAALRLSPREVEIAQAVFDDQPEGVIAEELGLSVHTVHSYLKRLYQKLGARSRVDVVCILVAKEKRLLEKQGRSNFELDDYHT